MKRARVAFISILFLFAFGGLAGCASDGGGDTNQAQAAKDTPPPPGSKLSKVKAGMVDAEVRKIMGDPDNANAYMTGKAWIPFYFGPDASRSDWMYKGQGRVVYSRNRYSGALKVIRVIYNPEEKAE